MSGRLIGAGLVLLVGGGVKVYDMYDKARNYVTVQARVMTVNDTCYMEKREGKKTYTSDTLPCALAEIAVKEHPKWQGYDIKHNYVIKFAYISPVDKTRHEATLKLHKLPKPMRTGDVMPVLASVSEAGKVREA